MPPCSATPASRFPLPASRRFAAFTLIELLVVMLVIVVLAGIVFKAGRALQDHGKIQQAKADLARLSMAVERYYADHGSYPPGSELFGNVWLFSRDFEVTLGWTEVANGHGGAHLWAYLDEECTYRRDRRSYVSGWPKDRLGSVGTDVSAYVLRYYKDPWGNPYLYIVIETRGNYTIMSFGPDGVGNANNPGPDDIWVGSGNKSGEGMGR